MIFEPLDFIARLAALVPKPRVNLTRFHGVFAPNAQSLAVAATLATKRCRPLPDIRYKVAMVEASVLEALEQAVAC